MYEYDYYNFSLTIYVVFIILHVFSRKSKTQAR